MKLRAPLPRLPFLGLAIAAMLGIFLADRYDLPLPWVFAAAALGLFGAASGAEAQSPDTLYAKAKAEGAFVLYVGGPTEPWEAMAKRFGELGEYDVKGESTVMFAVNSSAVNEQGRKDLQALAAQAKQIKSYMIHIAGYTDSSGNPDYNQQLSDKRAAAVTQYLQKSCGIALYRVLAPDALGEAHPAGSNETASGKAANRRVEVKILVNRGIAGS